MSKNDDRKKLKIDLDYLTNIKGESDLNKTAYNALGAISSHPALDTIANHDRMTEKILGAAAMTSSERATLMAPSFLKQLESVNSAHVVPELNVLPDFLENSEKLARLHLDTFSNTYSKEVFAANTMLSENYKEQSQALSSVAALLKSESVNQIAAIQNQISQLTLPGFHDLKDSPISLGNALNFGVLGQMSKELERFSSATSVFPYESLLADIQSSILPTDVIQSAISIADQKHSAIRGLMDTGALTGLLDIEASLRTSALNAINVTADLYANFDSSELLEITRYRELVSEGESFDSHRKFSITEFIGVMLAILLHLHSIQMNVQSSKEIQQTIDNVESNLLAEIYVANERIKNLQEENEAASYEEAVTEYIVLRAVKLRTQSNTGKESHIISVLYPNQKVELLKRNKKWIYIGYFDHVDGVPKTGWVYKKYLKILNKK